MELERFPPPPRAQYSEEYLRQYHCFSAVRSEHAELCFHWLKPSLRSWSCSVTVEATAVLEDKGKGHGKNFQRGITGAMVAGRTLSAEHGGKCHTTMH